MRNVDTIRKMRPVEMLARIIQAEAGAEPRTGKLAVGAVIDNRRRSGRYGNDWFGVITRPGQFSAINDVTGYARGLGANDLFWRDPSPESLAVARTIIAGNYDDPTGGATHYYNPALANPSWAKGKKFTRIGNHVFGRADAGADTGDDETAVASADEPTRELREPTREEIIAEAMRRGLVTETQLRAVAGRRGIAFKAPPPKGPPKLGAAPAGKRRVPPVPTAKRPPDLPLPGYKPGDALDRYTGGLA